jgi:hypothetical protein
VSDTDLLVLVPSIIFAVGVAAVVVLAFTRNGRVGWPARRRRGKSRRS